MDCEILDPGPVAEADRVHVLIARAEADQLAVVVGDQDGGVVRLDRLAQGDGGAAFVP